LVYVCGFDAVDLLLNLRDLSGGLIERFFEELFATQGGFCSWMVG